MKKKRYFNIGKVKCSSCGNYHFQWWMLSYQKKISKKIGCASTINYNLERKCYEVQSYYGSSYDGLTFAVVKRVFTKNKICSIQRLIEKVEKSTGSLICDKCINRFIHRKYISRL